MFFRFWIVWLWLLLSGCSYRMGYENRQLPQNIKSVHIPIFLNGSAVVGPEVEFTNQLIQEFKRSGVAEIEPDKKVAEGVLQGRIISLTRVQRAAESQQRDGAQKTTGMVNLPRGTYVATEYLLRAKVELLLWDRASKHTIWKQWFTDEALYSSARLALKGINTATPHYTESEEQRVLRQLSEVMMREAVDRLTENF